MRWIAIPLAITVTALLGAAAVSQTGPAAPTPPASPTQAAQPAVCDAQCLRDNAGRAALVCPPRVEDEAPGDYEWLQRPAGGIFKEADTAKADAPTIVRYRGDSIRFLSPQKEWVRAIYECVFDTAKGQAVQVNVRLGVLGKASAVPPVPAPPQAQAPKVAPGSAANGQATPAAAAPAAGAPTSDRRKVGEGDDVSILQVKPPKGGR